ncbi:Eaa1 [Klebsiella pneumoniae]|nr:DUF551 domain-containing protein [Klebsiella pneumoniae]SYI89252.1 Eaa1 [Klebsiella pneumoniae]
MTKSTITRERAQQIFLGNGPEPSASEERELARMALAAMDSSESVELPLDYLQGHKDGLEWAARLAEANHPETGDWLYDDPIELAKAIRKGPDMPPAQPVADSEPVAVIDLANLDYLLSGADADVWPPEREEMGDVLLYRHAQPAPVSYSDFEEFWSAYIHPLAQDDELKDFSWGIWNACVSNSQPAPVVPDGYVMVPKEMTDEIGEAIAMQANCCGGIALDIYDAMLAAAPHDTPALNSVQSVVTVPGKLIPVSEQKPDCWCLTCRHVVLNDMRFVVCPDCGNKRCPRANDHRNACTGSNEPGQEGSAYPAAPQSPGNEPATVPGKWIPVSERMTEDEQEVLTINRMGHRFVSFFDKHSGLYFDRLDAPAACCIEHVLVTHWMPLPAGPQEVR